MTQKEITRIAINRTTAISIVTNVFLSVTKITLGVVSHSSALIADGVHSFADMVSDFFTYAMVTVAQQDADDDHPYGHGKFETMGTLAIALLIFATACGFMWDSLSYFLSAQSAPEIGQIALIGVIVSIVANEGLYYYCVYWGTKAKSSLILANAWHHRTDSLSSIAALIGIVAALFGFGWADAAATLVIAAMLIKMSLSIGKKAFDELVETAVDPEKLKAIEETIAAVPHIHGTHQLRTRYIGQHIALDAHLDIPSFISVTEGHALADATEDALKKAFPDIQDVVLHIDPLNVRQATLPPEIQRQEITEKVAELLRKEAPEASVENITIHYLKETTHLRVAYTNPHPLSTQEVTTLQHKISRYLPIHTLDICYTHAQEN